MKRDITAGSADIRRIRREYYKECYTYEFDKLKGTNQFLERHNLNSLIMDTDNLNSLISTTEIKFVSKILPKNKSQIQLILLENSTKHLKS